MTTFAFPQIAESIERLTAAAPVNDVLAVDEQVALAVRRGLGSQPKRLPAWLFYDRAGSRLFDEITERPEYYLTRTERSILAANAGAIIARAADGGRLRISELGAGSAGKTQLLLKAAVARQGTLDYEPLDISASALEQAKLNIEGEIAGVTVTPRVTDYTQDSARSQSRRRLRGPRRTCDSCIDLEPAPSHERRLLLYIGSSIGNFDPGQARQLLSRVRASLRPGDGFLLGVDLVKERATLLAAYDDFAGVTADFNLNLLVRLNRELDAEFILDSFEHRAVWNETESRIEMHLESRAAQTVWVAALELKVEFAQGETIHTENSYKFTAAALDALLHSAGFATTRTFHDPAHTFAVTLAMAK